MPTRLIRPGINASERVDQLDYPAETFYRRLLLETDDYGLFDARPPILRAKLYPLRVARVREADISRWLAACQTAGLIVLYEAGGKQYGKALDTRWQTRSAAKHPFPPEGMCEPLQTTENSCAQLRTIGEGAGANRLSKAQAQSPPRDGNGESAETQARRFFGGHSMVDAATFTQRDWAAMAEAVRKCGLNWVKKVVEHGIAANAVRMPAYVVGAMNEESKDQAKKDKQNATRKSKERHHIDN